LFKRRKPDAPVSDSPLPAGLPLVPEDFKAEKSESDFDVPFTSLTPTPSDNGLGVPPFRPAPLKDAQIMSRPPFSSAPTMPAAPAAPVRTGMTLGRPAPRDPSERRTLVVGRGISLQGVVQDAERLVVEGTVEATMIHATELAIAPGGIFKGEVEVEEAEIAGTIDGTLTARGSLIVRGSGKVLGTARCRRLQVEDGGQITGRIEMISDQVQADPPPRQTVEPAI
jgi:cytoskeletal protein CcmA (bactofilin family)